MRYLILSMITLLIPFNTYAKHIRVTKEQAKRIGQKIWKNECGGKTEGLTHWIKGEPCASLGIGHFIWYPKNASSAQYTQTFPKLLNYFKKNGVALPKWLEKTQHYCPWKSREDFFAHKASEQMIELRNLLASHIDLQARFIVDRLMQALPTILSHAPKKRRAHIKRQFYRVAQSKNGLYALIDYINFKGEGVNQHERYKNQGWGLLQVLNAMNGTNIKLSATHKFAQAARNILKKRVNNAPKSNTIDKKFLPGWLNRIQTYIKT